MKIVLLGERKSGKSNLCHRLAGKQFNPEYSPTPEIKVNTILYTLPQTQEQVKLEVWDVVCEFVWYYGMVSYACIMMIVLYGMVY